MRKILQTIKKNYKVLFRNKFSVFILLFGPIILTLLIGFFYFNSNAFAINLGLFSPDDSEFNLFFKYELEKSDFSILNYNSQLDCENAIKSGLVHACIYLPKDFSINDSINNELILKIDTSRGDIVAVTENLINDQITKISTQVQVKNTQKLLNLINNSEELIDYTSLELKKITTINTNLKVSNNNIKSETKKFGELFNTKTLGIDDLSNNFKGLNSSLFSFTKSGIKSSNETLNDLLSALEKLNELNGSDTSDVKTLIKSAKSENSNSITKFNSLKQPYYLKELGKIVIGVEDKLGNAAKDSGDIYVDLSFTIDQNSKDLDNSSAILTNINSKGDDFKNLVATLDSKNAQTLMTPISVKTLNVVPNSSVHLVSIFPSLIVGLIFIISLIMSSMFILTERKNKAHFRNFMSKNSAFNFLVGDFLSLTSIVFLQAGLIISLYHFWFLKSQDYIQFVTLLALVLPIISIFVLVGMLVGYLTKSESSNVILTFLVILGFLTLSGKILPIESLSPQVAEYAVKNPFILGESMIRKFLLFGVDISQLKSELLLLGAYSGIFFILNFILESFSKKRFLYGVISQFVLGVRNAFLHPKEKTEASSTLTSPLIKSKSAELAPHEIGDIIKTTKVNIPIKEKNNEYDDVFELESLSSLNEKIKKL